MRFSLSLCAMLLAGLAAPALAEPLGPATVENPPPPPPSPTPLDRAQANYEAILAGRTTYFALTPHEQAEVRELDRRVRATQPPDTRNSSERCEDAEYARLGREPTALDQRAIEARCR